MSDNSQSTAVSPRPSLEKGDIAMETEKDARALHVPEHGEGTGEQFSEMLKFMNKHGGHDAEGMLEKTIIVDRGKGDEEVVLIDWEEGDPEVRSITGPS